MVLKPSEFFQIILHQIIQKENLPCNWTQTNGELYAKSQLNIYPKKS